MSVPALRVNWRKSLKIFSDSDEGLIMDKIVMTEAIILAKKEQGLSW